MFGLDKKPAFPIHLFCLWSLKERILHECVSPGCIIILGNWWYRNFFPTRSDFPGKPQKSASLVFTILPKHIKIKSPLKYESVCGRVASGLSTALSSYNRSIRRSSLDGAWFTHYFFLYFWISVLSPSFSLLIYYISLYHIIFLPFLTDLGFAWKILSFLNYFCFIFSKNIGVKT